MPDNVLIVIPLPQHGIGVQARTSQPRCRCFKGTYELAQRLGFFRRGQHTQDEMHVIRHQYPGISVYLWIAAAQLVPGLADGVADGSWEHGGVGLNLAQEATMFVSGNGDEIPADGTIIVVR